MQNPWIKIKVNKYVFTYCVSVSISKTYVGFTDTATITLPNVIYRSEKNNIERNLYNMIKRADPVEIWMGDREYISEFKGFVNSVKIDDLITINCENYAFALKQINVKSKIFKDTTLKEVIDYILNGVNITVVYGIPESTKLGDIGFENNSFLNVLQVLQELQTKYNINSFFSGKNLIIGQFTEKTGEQKNLIFENNIIDNSLEYVTDENLKLVVKGVSIIPSSKKDEKTVKWITKENGKFTVSDTEIEGETRTMNFYNLSESDLVDRITSEYERYNYTGFQGGFQTFIKPSINPSDSVYFTSLLFDYKKGEYKVRSVTKKYDTGGMFQDVELDYKLR